MSVPITPWPQIINIDVSMEQIGEVAGINGYGYPDYTALMGGVINGDAFFYTDVSETYYSNHQLNSFLIKRDGTNCRYVRANSNAVFGANTWGHNCLQIGANTITCGDNGGAIQKFTIPNTFINNGIVYVPNELSPPPASPCGGGQFQEVVYDSVNNLVAYVYTTAFPNDTFYWVSIYQLLPQGLVLINAGYIGFNGDGITDLFNRISLNLPPYIENAYVPGQGALRYSGGWSAYASIFETGAWNFGAAKQSIVQGGGPLVCGGAGNSQTYAVITDSFNFSYDRAPPNFAYFNVAINGYSENPNIFVSDARYDNFYVFSKDFFAQIYTNATMECVVILKDGTIIGVGNPQSWDSPSPIYKGFLDFEAYGLVFRPVVTQSQGQLINFSRPVSTNRSFIT